MLRSYGLRSGVALAAALLLVSALPARDYSKLPARKSPAWVRDAVIYEIFPRVFSPEGNFNGVTARLDDLKKLGVTVLWIMPIHPMSQVKKKGTLGSPYAVHDYYAINPDYGTKEDFKRLVNEAHKRGLKVILDEVCNHTGWDNVLMKTPEFYKHDRQGHIIPPEPDWEDVAALNYDNPKLREYMIEMLKYWVREFDLDGFRCDVAGEVPTSFWDRARDELEKVKPDLMMLAEAHKPELLVKAFDLDYSWPLLKTLNEVMMRGLSARALRASWEEERAEYPRGALHMRISDDHDEPRAIARFGERGALAASAFMFTIDGVPLLYNGMEVGDTAESGDPALFERIPILWQIAKRRPEFPLFYRKFIALRREHPALRQGETEWLTSADNKRVVAYLRRGGGEEFLVAINLSNRPFFGPIEVGARRWREVTPDLKEPDRSAGGAQVHPAGLPLLALEPWGFRIFQRGECAERREHGRRRERRRSAVPQGS